MRVVVASLCPWPLKMERANFLPNNTFKIPAVPRGASPQLLVIEDNHHQWEKILSDKPAIRFSVPAIDIAKDFVLHMALNGPNMVEGCRPPVWICEDEDGNYADRPSELEIEHNMNCFLKYCQAEVDDADTLHLRRSSGEANVPRPSPRQKDCARYLYLKPEWLSNQDPKAMSQCPYCTTTVPSGAVKCPKCSEIINPEKYAAMRAEVKKATQFAPRPSPATQPEA